MMYASLRRVPAAKYSMSLTAIFYVFPAEPKHISGLPELLTALKDKNIINRMAKFITTQGNDKMSVEIIFRPIGWIETRYKTVEDLNIPSHKKDAPYNNPDITGIVHLHNEYCEGIRDIKAGASAMLIFHFNQSKGYVLITSSPSFEKPVGVFSTRSPNRPNGIGVSIVKIISVAESEIVFQGVDMLDGTPLLDIKPDVYG